MPHSELLDRLENYLDTAPRANARAEDIGPFTLFVSQRGWPYYARPGLGVDDPPTADEVAAVRARQRDLGVPESFEWVEETTPGLGPAAEAAGLQVSRNPLLVLDRLVRPTAAPTISVGLLRADDPALAQVRAAVEVGFQHGGTTTGAASVAERDRSAVAQHSDALAVQRELLATGLLVVAGAFTEEGAVGGGSHAPRRDVSEITGVAVLPAWRRRGIATQVTSALAQDAVDRGVRTVFCSAESGDVARVYERIGFRRIGTIGSAEPA